jgi:hypothetical protein
MPYGWLLDSGELGYVCEGMAWEKHGDQNWVNVRKCVVFALRFLPFKELSREENKERGSMNSSRQGLEMKWVLKVESTERRMEWIKGGGLSFLCCSTCQREQHRLEYIQVTRACCGPTGIISPALAAFKRWL